MGAAPDWRAMAVDNPTWSPSSCLDNSGSLYALLARRKVMSWTAFGTPWDEWLNITRYCAMPSAGTFAPAGAASPTALSCSKSGLCCDSLDGGSKGFWLSSSVWEPSVACAQSRRSGWVNFHGILACLAGRVLVFYGDSLTRQLFMRLVWWLRGIPALVEHYYNGHSLYVFSEASDHLHLFEVPSRKKNGSDSKSAFERTVNVLSGNAYDGSGQPQAALLFMRDHEGADTSLLDEHLALAVRHDRIAGVVSGRGGAWNLSWPTRATAGTRAAMTGPLTFWPSRPKVIRRKGGRDAHGSTPPPPFSMRHWPAEARMRWRHDVLSLDAMNACGGAAHYFVRNRIAVCRDRVTIG